jgi:hypothetical protein
MIVDLIEGAPGTQKSRTLMIGMVQNPGRYLMASPRIALMKEQAIFIREKAGELGIPAPLLTLIHSENGQPGDVHRQLANAAAKYANAKHVVVLITHETLRAADMSRFAGWHARIDEVPDGVTSGSFQAGAAFQILDPIYRLHPMGESGWSEVVLREQGLRPSEVMHDTGAQPLEAFHQCASGKNATFVNVSEWADARGRGRRVDWWSLWTPLDLDCFASVTIACASFEHSLCCITTQNWFGSRISFRSQQPLVEGPRACPHITIYYFAEGHTGSTTFWGTTEGRKCLNHVARYFMRKDGVGFWSGNEVVRHYLEHWVPGDMVLPKVAGTNSLIEHTSCAMIYSSKPQQSDTDVYGVFGIGPKQVKRARETEDLIQFVMRGAIRRPEFDGRYDVYVYERPQAEELRVYLQKNTTPNVELRPITEAGILHYVRDDISASRSEGSPQQTAEARRAASRERSAKYRAGQKSKKLLAGTYAGPGRPKRMNQTVQDGPQ